MAWSPLGCEPDALDGAVGGPRAGVDKGPMGERNDMQDCGFDLFGKDKRKIRVSP